MSLKLDSLAAAVAENTTATTIAVEHLGTGTVEDPAVQATVDAATSSIEANTKQLVSAVEAASKTTPTPTAGPTQAVYVHTGEGQPDPEWTASGFETAEGTPRPLFYFKGDTPGATPPTEAGVSAGWEVWKGAVHPVA
jgi:hypothetical protein